MELLILFGVFTALMLIGTPIAFCLGVSSFATVLYMGLPPLVVFQRLNSGMSVFSLLAIPFFIYAGDLMVAASGVSSPPALRGGYRGRRFRRLDIQRQDASGEDIEQGLMPGDQQVASVPDRHEQQAEPHLHQ